MIVRLKILLVAASVAIAGGVPCVAGAKTVKTDTITVTPGQTPGGSSIPEGDVPSVMPSTPEDAEPEAEAGAPANQDQVALPEVLYDLGQLPPPVARMHAQLLEAALGADFNRLRMVLESNEMPPTLSLTEIGDPIQFLKESSGDDDGLEVLGILADTLSAGFVHVDVGTAQEMYIWPYFARYPLTRLTPQQKVEMYRLITSADFAEMEDYGVWLFYRVGIGKDGTLHYFVAGE
ncbi:hypothetical protein [Roseibium sp.]|uniref:hypothetical protein n=1 Tax=Roseibium sp. TaxID=1936156 RepID=UPI003A97D8BD